MKLDNDKIIVHNFIEKLEWSQKLSDEPSWLDFYRNYWPDMLSAIRIDKDSKFQRYGIDRLILLSNGKQITIDEKKRDKDYGDILIEEWSVGNFIKGNYVGKKIGWALDDEKRCDFVAYAIIPARKCYLLPFELLRHTSKRNLDNWKKIPGAYPKDSPNPGYWTRNIGISWAILSACMIREMCFGFGSFLELPIPVLNPDNQLIFNWTLP